MSCGHGAQGARLHLRKHRVVDARVHLAHLEQVLAVVTGRRMTVRRRGERELPLGLAGRRRRSRAHHDGAVEAHLDLHVRLRPAVVRVRPGPGRGERVGDGVAVGRLAGEQARDARAAGRHLEAGKHDRGVPRRDRQVVPESHRDRVSLGDDQRRAGELHPRAVAAERDEGGRRAVTAVAEGVDRRPVRLADVVGARNEVEGRAGDARHGGARRRRREHQPDSADDKGDSTDHDRC